MRHIVLAAAFAVSLAVAGAAAAEEQPFPVELPAAAAPGSAPADAPATSATPEARRITAVDGLEAQLLAAINALRRERGLVPLRANPGLATAAEEHSLEMARYGFFRHTSNDGAPFWKRVKARYAPRGRGYWGVGENLVWGSPDLSASRALEMWVKSPPHRKNLLTPAWREVGLGGVHVLAAPGFFGGLDVTILTANFGVRG